MKEALAATDAKIVYVCNIMADKGETTTYELPDFIANVEKYAGPVVDLVLVNSGDISQELVDKYKGEGKKPVKLKNGMELQSRRMKVIECDFVNESDYVRHDPKKLAGVLIDICRGWIK